MSSYMMHLAISNNVKKKLHLTDNFLYGSILPDILKEEGQDRNINHYIKEEIINGSIRRLPDISKAIEDMNKFQNKEIAMGYIAHLIEDYIWFSVYIPSYVDKINDEEYIYLKDGVRHTGEEFTKTIYSDYTNTNEYALKLMEENLEDLKNRLKDKTQNNIEKDIIQNGIYVKEGLNIADNILMTKESIDSYIEITTNEVEKLMNKLI